MFTIMKVVEWISDLTCLITMVVCTVVRNSKSRLEMYGYQPALNSVIFGIYMVLGLAT